MYIQIAFCIYIYIPCIYHVYRYTLYPMVSYVYPMYILRFPMYILCFPLLFSGSRQCIYIDDHGILHYMTCSSAFWVPAAAASCALLAHLNVALLLPA